MKENTSKFKENDIVRVLPDVVDPDFNTNIGGWTGQIEEIEIYKKGSWLYRIRWDKETIAKEGGAYIDKCERENLDYKVMYLEENDLELIKQPEILKNGFFLA
jgi:hypothetical protein